jgi:LuxR family maltose regulon positive regulatory protein
MIAIDKGDPAAAEEHLATLDLRRLTPELRSVYAAVRGLADLLMGRYVLGAHRLAAAAAKRAGPPVVRLFTDTVQSLLLLAADRPRAARAVLADHSPQHPLVAATRARVELHLGHAEKALAVLATVNDEDMPLRVRCTVALVTATAKTRLNRDAEAAEAVSGLLAHMQEAGLHLPLLLLSRSDREAVVRAVEDNVEGCTAWLRDLVDAPDLVPERHQEIRLTERELVVLDALVRSGSLSEIAEELFVSVNTVKSQVRSVYRKFGVNRREDALRVAGDHGLLPGLADDD